MTISRREFLGLGSLLLAACGGRASRAAPRDAGTGALAPTPYIADDDGPPPLVRARCAGATAANIEGPFYKRGAPHRAVLVDRDVRGERLAITGTVLTTTCEPIANAELDIWHADAAGAYDLDGYQFRGALTTDANGRYELHTIVPGRYLNGDTYRPAHVHVKLRARGHRELTTQLYFTGDPYNDKDPFIVESLIMNSEQLAGVRRATFDFVLA
jgi:protocatechuate 3,4-dioxygenase beta subunit